MFETAALSSGPSSKRFWSTCIGVAGETLLLGCAVLVPVLSPQVLPRAMFVTMLAPPGVPPPPPAPGPMVRPRSTRAVPRMTFDAFVAPSVIPKTTPRIVDEDPEPVATTGIAGGIAGGSKNGMEGGVLGSILTAGNPVAPPPHAPAAAAVVTPPPPAPAIIRVREGGRVKLAEPVYRPEPPYPPLARQMRISGTVELEGVIGIDGHLRELRIVSGHPLLARAALQTVSQWIYKPTTLNGDPVEVVAPIKVTFHLN